MSRLGQPLEAFGSDDLVDVEERVLLQADVDERGLHARQDVLHLAEVDVADNAAFRPFDVEFDEFPVLENRDPGLARVVRDEHLACYVAHRTNAPVTPDATTRLLLVL